MAIFVQSIYTFSSQSIFILVFLHLYKLYFKEKLHKGKHIVKLVEQPLISFRRNDKIDKSSKIIYIHSEKIKKYGKQNDVKYDVKNIIHWKRLKCRIFRMP